MTLAGATSTITHCGPVFAVERLEYRDGSGRAVRRDIVRHPRAVTIVPVLADGRIVMVRNFRVSVEKRLLELPAGKLERDEAPSSTAVRELEEETGYTPSRVTPIGSFYTTPGFSDEIMHVFLAEGLTDVGQRLEPGEEIEVERVSMAEVRVMIRDGRIRDGKTIASFALWLGLGSFEGVGSAPSEAAT